MRNLAQIAFDASPYAPNPVQHYKRGGFLREGKYRTNFHIIHSLNMQNLGAKNSPSELRPSKINNLSAAGTKPSPPGEGAT
jgi:hypothetical protein